MKNAKNSVQLQRYMLCTLEHFSWRSKPDAQSIQKFNAEKGSLSPAQSNIPVWLQRHCLEIFSDCQSERTVGGAPGCQVLKQVEAAQEVRLDRILLPCTVPRVKIPEK